MRIIIALVVVGLSLSSSGCSRQAAKHVRSSQSQPSVQKFTKASLFRAPPKRSRPVKQRSKQSTVLRAKPTQTQVSSPTSDDAEPSLPPRKPEQAHVGSTATDEEAPPPVPPRKTEETPTAPADSREHAVKPETSFAYAKEKAEREGVHALTSEDIRGLSQEQIKELRGY